MPYLGTSQTYEHHSLFKDILIYSKTYKEHDDHVCQFTQQLQEYGLCSKENHFNRNQHDFLNYVVLLKVIYMDLKKVQIIMD